MTQTERLVKIYQDSRKRLLADVRRRRVYGTSTYYQEELIRQIDRELRRLNVDTSAWAQEAIPAAYARGARLAYQAVSADTRAIAAFGGLNTRAVEIMAQNTQDFLQITNSLVARQAQDVVRRVGVEVTAKKFSEMLTVRETTKLLETRLDEEGFFARVPFRDGRGSMRLDSYAELVARTTTAEATNTGTLNMMGEMGQVLVKMTAHNTTCRVCAPRQGRVYRTVEAEELPEGDPRRDFPHIREGMPRWPTYKTIHPNCAHRLLPYIWSQKTKEEQAEALQGAKSRFDLDPRGEAERLRYEKAQRENAERLRDRKQWERYKAVLGDQAPKTFSGFRAMKRAGSMNYLDLQSLYRRTNYENAIIGAAKTPGGRHHGKYADASTWTDKSVRRAYKSYGKTASEHLGKIQNPAAFDKNWDSKTDAQKEGLLDKWKKDYARNEELRIIMGRILQERGINLD